jgi:DNA polymerase-3 subunit gamma/tau
MENYIVSARKYRPQRFDSVVGQSHITSTLRNAIVNKQLAQAYLFCGPRGVGKTTCARIFAKTINCSSLSPEGEFCDRCDSCVSFNEGASMNIYELDAASNNSVDDIRSLVDQVRFAPQLGEYKVYIIDEVHMLSTAAFNAFLKTLEEPPRHAKFILATTEKHKIIPTILSRCQIFNFNRINAADISRHLAYISKSENVAYEPEALEVISQKAEGGLRDALSMFDQMVAFTRNNLSYKLVAENLNVLDQDYYFRITEAVLSQNIPALMLVFDEILRKGFDGHEFVAGLSTHFRNLLVMQDPQTISLLDLSEKLKERYRVQAAQCKPVFLLRAMSLAGKADLNFKMARNQRLLVEMTLLQISHLNAPPDPEKKNEIAEPAPAAQAKSVAPVAQKVVLRTEPEVKVAAKPQVSFNDLKIKASFSLNEALSGKKTAGAEKSQEVKEPSEEGREIILNDVQAFLNTYADEKQAQGAKQIATIFRTAIPELVHKSVILTTQNETQREQLLAIRQDFSDEIRKRLRSPTIQVEIRVVPVDSATRAYKPADIYREMAEKNPALPELKKRLGLELDY